MNKKLIYSFITLASLGFIDSLYLLTKHFKPESVVCIGNSNCDLVLTSSYSSLFGIPTAAFGVIYYISLIIMFSIILEKNNLKLTKIALGTTSIGFLASAWFVYLQAFVIQAYCSFCLVSATISTLLFILSIYTCKKVLK